MMNSFLRSIFHIQVRCISTVRINNLLARNDAIDNIQIQGWITKLHKTGNWSFAQINDGSCTKSVQVVLRKNIGRNLGVGSAVQIAGNWVPSQGSQQSMELLATSCFLSALNESLPISGDSDVIRDQIHLRAKHPSFASILRLRSSLHRLSHQFFMDEQFYHIDTPLISINDCEGAGEAFVIKNPKDEDYFGVDNVFLPVSGQLHLEAVAGGLLNVYTISPAFRAEKSLSRQHMAEFRMLEAECAFMDSLNDLCSLIEKYIKFIVRNMEPLKEDIENLNAFYDDSSNRERASFNLIKMVSENQEFPRIEYSEAVKLLEKLCLPVKGGLNKEQELLLVKEFNSPVFITYFPSSQKPFYMKRDESERFAECFDLLAPYVGELAGGSVRENEVEKLRKRSDLPALEWYYELRTRGYPISSGFGLGIDRFMQSLFGILNIKDTIPFPRWYKHVQC